MRGLLVAGILLAGAGGALAADCDVPIVTGNQASFPGPILQSGGVENCTVTNVLPVGAPGRYVVYKVDSSGLALLDDGVDSTYTVTGEGQTKTFVLQGPFDDAYVVEQYFAAGLNPADGFDGEFDLSLGGDFFSDITSLDILAGWTTMEDQQNSLDQIGLQQAGIITHLDGISGLLTGGNLPLEGDNEVGVFGGVGSFTLGGNGRYNLADGFSLLGGASVVDFATPGASASGVIGAVALRYVEPTDAEFRLFGEGGLGAGGLSMSFSRQYGNGTITDYEATGNGNAVLGSGYLRGGVLWAPDSNNEIVVSASLKQSLLGFASYAEDMPSGDPNLFAADLTGSASSFTTVKVGADWTTQLAADVDLTTSLAVGSTMGSGASADVFGVGTVTGSAQSTLFTEYGLRLGWEPNSNSRIDGFVQGTTGSGIGTHAQIGAAYHQSF